MWPEERTLGRGAEGWFTSHPGSAQVSRQHGVGELLPRCSLGRRGANPPCLGAAGNSHGVSGPACGHRSTENAGLRGGELREACLLPAPPTPSSSGGGGCSEWPGLPLLPCSSLSAGPHTAGGTVWLPFTGSPAARDPEGWGWDAFTARLGAGVRTSGP